MFLALFSAVVGDESSTGHRNESFMSWTAFSERLEASKHSGTTAN